VDWVHTGHPVSEEIEPLICLRSAAKCCARSPVHSWSTRSVAKLRSGRERKRNETGKKVSGRKTHAELWPEVVGEARRLRRSKGKAGRPSYREISARLKDAGLRNERGEPFNSQSVRVMSEGPQLRPPRRL
jgi:hypothetical protein